MVRADITSGAAGAPSASGAVRQHFEEHSRTVHEHSSQRPVGRIGGDDPGLGNEWVPGIQTQNHIGDPMVSEHCHRIPPGLQGVNGAAEHIHRIRPQVHPLRIRFQSGQGDAGLSATGRTGKRQLHAGSARHRWRTELRSTCRGTEVPASSIAEAPCRQRGAVRAKGWGERGNRQPTRRFDHASVSQQPQFGHGPGSCTIRPRLPDPDALHWPLRPHGPPHAGRDASQCRRRPGGRRRDSWFSSPW